MIKKLINYVAIALMTFAIVAPATTSAAGYSLAANVANATLNQKTWVGQVNASAGDELLFAMKFSNQSSATATGLQARTVLPSGMSYVPGYAKVYYTDAAGTKQVAAVNDSLAGSGASIVDVLAGKEAFVVYKAKLSSTVAAGTYAPTNQVIGNGGAVSLSTQGGFAVVGGSSSNSTSGAVNSGTSSTPVVSGVTNPIITVVSSALNATKGERNYVPQVGAKRGEEVIYRMAIINDGNETATGLKARTVLPASLVYVPGYAKIYYEDANGIDKVGAADDSIASNGVILPNLEPGHWFYLVFKVRVADNAVEGNSAAANQVIGDKGISVSDNKGVVRISGGDVPSEQKNLFLNATAYNSTAAKATGFNSSVSANRGDVVKFHVDFANVGNAQLKNIKLSNALPANMEFVAGSVKVVLAGNTISTADSAFVSGISLGDLSVGATGYYEFQAKVKSETPSNVAQLTYSANGSADGIAGVSSVVTINLTSGSGSNTTLPNTGTALTVIALIILAGFISIASYIYMKESGNLEKALKMINR